MNIRKETCGECGGTGKSLAWRMLSKYETTGGDNVISSYETVCRSCNGKGYVEYVTFSVDEAKAILKHCGLSTES